MLPESVKSYEELERLLKKYADFLKMRKFNVKSNSIEDIEALARWLRGDYGLFELYRIINFVELVEEFKKEVNNKIKDNNVNDSEAIKKLNAQLTRCVINVIGSVNPAHVRV